MLAAAEDAEVSIGLDAEVVVVVPLAVVAEGAVVVAAEDARAGLAVAAALLLALERCLALGELVRAAKLLLPPPPKSCTNWDWLMLFNRLWSSESPKLDRSNPPDPPPIEPPLELLLPGAGGLFRKSFTFLHNSSSLSSLGSCIQKKSFLEVDLNFKMNTRPVVH